MSPQATADRIAEYRQQVQTYEHELMQAESHLNQVVALSKQEQEAARQNLVLEAIKPIGAITEKLAKALTDYRNALYNYSHSVTAFTQISEADTSEKSLQCQQ